MCGSSWTGAKATAAHHIQALPDSTDAGKSGVGLISISIPLDGRWSIRENAGRDPLLTDLWGHVCVHYYNATRTHLSLAKDAPEPRSVQPPSQGRVVELPGRWAPSRIPPESGVSRSNK